MRSGERLEQQLGRGSERSDDLSLRPLDLRWEIRPVRLCECMMLASILSEPPTSLIQTGICMPIYRVHEHNDLTVHFLRPCSV
jgi:hypothetical protein